MRRVLLLLLVPLLACSREAPPPAVSERPAPPPAAPAAATAAPASPSYDDAVIWLKTTPRFAFTLQEGAVRAEGEMTRPRVGAERVTFRARGEEWLGEAGPQGLAWKRRSGQGWATAVPPDYAGRLYQRVTVGFDPAKKEGSAQLAPAEGETAVYRFTDANSGEAWEVRVRADGSIERITVGDGVRLEIRK